MNSRFKINETVLVNGIGKQDGKHYTNAIGVVLLRDPYFFDYNIQFRDSSEDWLDEKYLKKYERRKSNENNLSQNSWI